MNKLIASGVGLLFLTPMIVAAQTGPASDFGDIGRILQEFTNLVDNILIPLVFALAVLAFFYGVFTYFVLGGADEGKREEGRKLMLYAIIGFVLMVSLFAVVNLIIAALGITPGGAGGAGGVGLPSVDGTVSGGSGGTGS